MKFKLTLLSLTLAACLQASAQDPTAQIYGKMITPTDLKQNLFIFASDAFEGRETGTRGQKVAAAFVSASFQDCGLTPAVNGSYYQQFELYTSIPGDIYVKAGKSVFKNYEEITYYGTADSGGEISLPVVFAGAGRAEDFASVDVKDKAVVVMLTSEENFRKPRDISKEKGAKMFFALNPDEKSFKDLTAQLKEYTLGGTMSLKRPEPNSNSAGVFFISPVVAEKIFNTTFEKLQQAASLDAKKNALKKIKPGIIQYKTSMDVKTTKTENVLGYLEGTDKKDELVIVTAHYDHIGREVDAQEGQDQINNGADDDGSGSVSVMQLAKVFSQAKKDGKGPRRSMLFMTFTGEEKGLLGSDYYTQHPVYPLANTVVDLNIDMVGRRDPQHKDSEPYVYVIGSDKLSTELHKVNEEINKVNNKLIFDYTYNDQNHPERLYYRSDHWNFAKNNVPIIFFFDGIHEDYHQPSDEPDKIEYDLLAKRAQCVFYVAWEIANREQRIMPDKK